jgi:hypothetical protein
VDKVDESRLYPGVLQLYQPLESNHSPVEGSDRSQWDPSPPRSEGLNSKHVYMFRREQKSWTWIPTGLETKNHCTGEGQQQFNPPTYSQPVTQSVSLSIKRIQSFMVIGPVGLGTKNHGAGEGQ